MSKVLAVTGASGTKSGSAFIRRLMQHSEQISKLFPDGVRLLVRTPEKLNGIDKSIPNCVALKGDLKDNDYLRNAFEEVDTVVHIAGIHFSCNVVEAAVVNQVRRLILVHTTGIYSRYKAAGEEYKQIDEFVYKTCKNKGIIRSVLRPTMIYGNVTDNNVVQFIKMVDKLPVMPVVNNARYKLQPVHYEDLAEAYYSVLINEDVTANKDYILSGGEEIELREMLSIIGEKLEKKVRFISCPFPVAYAGAWGIYFLTFGKKDYREKVQRLCEPRVFSYETAKKDFGYSPRIFQIGVVDEVKEYMNNKSEEYRN